MHCCGSYRYGCHLTWECKLLGCCVCAGEELLDEKATIDVCFNSQVLGVPGSMF
ncbi:hypothetical protein OIU77_004458 [Salix suchowensis]|uniref:Uncharacterized protein n=1 Tax=Salix suchowensis TaxID=1278906 RepID=A0ABQ9AVL8_9ROSI|nr:hypothetical protein OIU77_004458 [Salix suchowensis]